MTRIMEGVQIVSLAEGLISAKKQQGRFALDLTARGVSRVESGGALDFGGSAFREASAIALEPQKKTPEEPYGWWNLEPGAYLLAFNETVRSAGAGLILVFPHRRFLPREHGTRPLYWTCSIMISACPWTWGREDWLSNKTPGCRGSSCLRRFCREC